MMSTENVRDRRVELLRLGEGEPLLYLHGLADVHATFAPDEPTPLLRDLARDHEVVAPALPGYEGSDQLGPHADPEDHAFHLADVLDHLRIAEVDVVATSYGGWLAAELALRHPDRVRRLVLAGPLGLYLPGAPHDLFFGAAAPRGIGGFGEVRSTLFADPESPLATAALPDDMSRERQLRWFAGLAGAAHLGWRGPQLQNPKLRERLCRIPTPTLLVWGGSDRLAPPEYGREWEEGLPDARLVVVPDAGHAIVLEQPAAVSAAVRSHLSQHSTV